MCAYCYIDTFQYFQGCKQHIVYIPSGRSDPKISVGGGKVVEFLVYTNWHKLKICVT